MEQLGKLKSLLSKQEKEKVQILAVSVDTHEESKKFGDMLSKRFDGEFDFPLLEDKDHKVINRYGVFNPDGKGWPHPSTFIVDPKGVVRWKFIEVDYKKRPSNQQIHQQLVKIKSDVKQRGVEPCFLNAVCARICSRAKIIRPAPTAFLPLAFSASVA